MADMAALKELVEAEVRSLGYELVRVAFMGGTSDPTLQIMAERSDTRQLDLSDCERISRRLSDTLDALEAEGRDPVEGSYRLEVSSPGIDRPLTRPKDFADWAGHEARVTLAEPSEGRKQYSGTIRGLADGEIVEIEGKDGNEYRVSFTSIANAKLLLTDKLIKASAPLSTEGADTIQTIED